MNTNTLVAMTDANQNFSKAVRIVDDEGMAMILKNNKPKYIVVGFDKYESIRPALTDKNRASINPKIGLIEAFLFILQHSQLTPSPTECHDKGEIE